MRLPLRLGLSLSNYTDILINGSEALELCRQLGFTSVLDIGSGNGVHAALFREMGKDVTTVDIKPPADHVGKYTSIALDSKYDLIWCCHVLEHQTSVDSFLSKIHCDLKDGGYLVITVPQLKNEIVGGHVTLWNAGLLLYNLILAGFDCSQARVKTYGYNISVVVRRHQITLPPLKMDFGDIETLSKFFPFPMSNGFDGRIEDHNW